MFEALGVFAIVAAALIGLPALIGLINLSLEGFLIGAALSALAFGLGLVSWVLGLCVWLLACFYVVRMVNGRNARREQERRHKELLNAVRGRSP
jgi:membrane protein implicated in regulation of membrane protease activity